MVGSVQNKGESRHGLDRDSERQVAICALDSLFLVEVNPKHLLKEEDYNPRVGAMYKKIAEAVEAAETSRGIEHSSDAITPGTKERCSSGFAIARQGKRLRILTCAHTVEDVFTEGNHALTIGDVNTIFRFDVHCTHHEAGILKMVSPLKPSERVRGITPAEVVAMDTKLDLLVLEIDMQDLKGDNEARCSAKHPLIPLAKLNPKELEKLILPGWPPQRAKALSIGQVSHCDWSYDAISSLNVKGYDMKLLEIPCMAASSGFSGGPILNGESECVALFHGVFNGMTGYGVCLQDIHAFLDKHKMFSHWEDEVSEDEDSEDEDIEDEDSDYDPAKKQKTW